MGQYILIIIGIGLLLSIFLLNTFQSRKSKMGQVLYKSSLSKGHKCFVIILGIILVAVFLFLINEDNSKSIFVSIISNALASIFCVINSLHVVIIRENGIGRGNLLSNGMYELIDWNKIKGYRWQDNILNISYVSNNNFLTKEFKISMSDKSSIDDIMRSRVY